MGLKVKKVWLCLLRFRQSAQSHAPREYLSRRCAQLSNLPLHTIIIIVLVAIHELHSATAVASLR